MAEERPKGLYQGPGGIWYIDKWINGNRIKRSTKSTEFEVARAVLARETAMLNDRLHGAQWLDEVDAMLADPASWLRRTAQALAYRGRSTGKGCTVDAEDLADVLRRSGGRCEVSGIGLDLRRSAKGRTPPFHPSFDRRDSSLGYTYANTRVVCLCVNLCIRDWGEEVMHRVGRAMVLKEWAELTKPHLVQGESPILQAQRKTA
jgi:hypothetical protein